MFLGPSTLTDEERAEIEGAVRRSEAVTSGEIVVVVDRMAGSWRSWAMALALLIALLAPWPLIEFTQFATRTVFGVQLAVAVALVATFQASSTRLRLVPPPLRRRKAREAALREFTARGLTGTRDRTGVLIYVALAERHAEIVADTAVSARLGDGAWRRLTDALIAAIGQGELGAGLVAAVEEAGSMLGPHFPPRPGDADEIANKVIVI